MTDLSPAGASRKLPDSVDVAVIGAGPVGMTLALRLAGSGRRVLLIDRAEAGAHARDPRVLALSYGTRQLLERLGAWADPAATAIHEIHVGQSRGGGRTLLTAGEERLPALGYVMRYRDLAAALAGRIAALSARGAPGAPGLCHGMRLRHLAAGPLDSQLTLEDASGTVRPLAARLVVHAEGTPEASDALRVLDYRQHAVLAEVTPDPGHGGRAWEHFTPDGPLALLPLGTEYSVVFTVPAERARALLAADDAAFLAALQRQFGPRITFTAPGPRASFPLALRLRRQLTAPRAVWIGNSAQTLHPVSGQGFNLGIRDAWTLADALRAQPTRDPGDAALLARWARARQPDRLGAAAFTDGIVRLFSNDHPALARARGLGLAALDLLPPARSFIARRMIWGARAWP